MTTLKVITNHVPRFLLDASELSVKDRQEFDYLDWDKIDSGEDSATFFRYKDRLFDLGEFSSSYGITRGVDFPSALQGWDGYMSDSFFSAYVVKVINGESVIVGRVLS